MKEKYITDDEKEKCRKVADTFAKRDMNIQPKVFTFCIRQYLVISIFERKCLRCPCKPHSR